MEITRRASGMGSFFQSAEIQKIAVYRPFPKPAAGWHSARMDLPPNKIFGVNLRRWRDEHDISVLDIVKAVSIDQRYYQRIEGGEENPSFNVLTRINGFLTMPWERMMPPIGCLCVFLAYSVRRGRNGGSQSSRS